MKSGIDYFPLDVTLDDKFELIEAEYGLTGFAIVVKLLQRVYGGHGYYSEWTNEVALLFGKSVGMGGNAVSEIVTAAIRRGIFDKEIFDKYQILTSVGIQKRYFEAVSRRKEIKVRKEVLLVDVTHFSKNVDIQRENVNKKTKNVDIFKQSKEEKSKVKNNILSSEVSTDDKPAPPPIDELINPIAINLAEKLQELILKNNPKAKVSGHKDKWAKDIDKMLRLDKRTEEEILKVINFSQNDGFWKANILSAGKLREKFDTLWMQSQRSPGQKNNFQTNKPQNMSNFEQRNYDSSYFESVYEDV